MAPAHTDAESFFFQGTRRLESGDVAGAETCFRQALQIAPDFAEAHANLGLLLDKQGHAEEAEICYRRSIELNPAYSETYLNLGVLLANNKRFNEAEITYRQAITLKPHSSAGWSNMGVLFACMKREVEAEQCYRTAMFLDASYAKARFNLSYLLLRQGRFEEGWQHLEARNWHFEQAAHFTCPRWQGEPLAGKSILLSHEAGHGDVIQFCRYAAVLKAQGAGSITLVCHPALKPLLVELEAVDKVFSFTEEIPVSGWDYWTPLFSIPHYCETRLESIPAKIPYLRVPASRIEKWATLLPTDGLRVGLVWKGNPQFENDADRSLPSLEVLAPLWAVAGVNFISLQKRAGEDEAAHPPVGMPLIHLGDRLADFADTAAVVSSLDLVICVDTAVAHLTGALGKPCWVLLPDYKPDWRWLVDRTDSPWYPVMRLFRQPAMGDWVSVVAEVVMALELLVRRAG
ncbi:MAG: tetratricopeptide repeat protein [Nitrosomonadales bacterium]